MDPRLFSLADEQLFPDLRGQLGASLDQLERYVKIAQYQFSWTHCFSLPLHALDLKIAKRRECCYMWVGFVYSRAVFESRVMIGRGPHMDTPFCRTSNVNTCSYRDCRCFYKATTPRRSSR